MPESEKQPPHEPPTSEHDDTRAIRTDVPASGYREHSPAVYLTSSFAFENAEQARAMFANEVEGPVYSRYSNPSVDLFVAKMCALEEAEAGVAVGSGMSAVFTSFAALLDGGDQVLAARSVFGSTHQVLTQLLPRWGITANYVEITEPETWAAAVTPQTKLCYVETPSNPTLDLVDLDWLAGFCRERGIILVVDNIFATSILQKPIRHGADLVIHSATKYIDGQGRGLGGVILGRADLMQKVAFFARHTGPALSPFNAWMFAKSLETLPLRMRQHSENALALARFLEGHAAVASVRYPHLPSHPQYDLAKRQMTLGGGIVTFELTGGLEAGRRFLDGLRMCSLTANLGDTRTIATHPASTTHSKLREEERQAVGIRPGTVRISAGLEAAADIIADVAHALEAAG